MTDKRFNPNNTETHRQCAKCGQVKEREDFPKATDAHDGVFPYCRECVKANNAANYQKNKAKISARRTALKQEFIDMLGGKCSRCGYNEFVAGLDFHHLSDKDNEMANLITKAATGNGKQRDLLLAEVRKCTLLCANCHRARHAGEW